MTFKQLVKDRTQVNVQLGGGEDVVKGFINVDIRPLPSVDIVHDLEIFPWPIPSNSVNLLVASQLVEHINPHKGGFLDFMDEAWRVLKTNGQFMIATPYGGSSAYIQDPTHVNPCNEMCVTSDTEVLTYDGFKFIDTITKKDKVLSLNPENNRAEYVDKCKLVSFSHDGPMIHFSGRAIDLITNFDHNVWYSTRKKYPRFEFSKSEAFLNKNPNTTVFDSQVKLSPSDRLEFVIPTQVVPKNATRVKNLVSFNIEDFCEFMGWFLSEGSVDFKNTRVAIAQVKEKNRIAIKHIIEKLGFHPVVSPKQIMFSAYHLSHYLAQFGHCEDKFIPRELLSAPQWAMKKMFLSLIAGDGCWDTPTQFRYTTLSKRLADDVQELALKCGYRASVTHPGETKKDKIIYTVCGSVYSPIYAKEFKKIANYKGSVHSLVMPKNHIYLARRNGKCVWTGNTWEYFDPFAPTTNGALYLNYRPKPWKIVDNSWYSNGNMEILLEKRPDDPSYHQSDFENVKGVWRSIK